ncbi:MAG TPA: sigma-54 dependent transcriptional regulator [candidate division Zixibacteria bacterium]|nr:sigma-54 dependent transcriptional regulator [candidate division Zixibacteria bacterium]
MAELLIVDDEKLVREFLSETLSQAGYAVRTAENGEAALKEIADREFDLIFTDVKMPQLSGIELLKAVRQSSPFTSVVVITAYGTVADAVEAMKLGAFDYLPKPFTPEHIEVTAKKALEYRRLLLENRRLKKELAGKFENIIGRTPAMKKVFDLVESVAPSRATVLIVGESGTGKELIARAIHHFSPRKDAAFVRTNCAALPEGLIESELFGHEKGAFTGALRQTRGRFEMADGGTLLLDEISEIPLGLQAKLLRVLQEREFERVGSGYTLKVDVRVVATTNRNLDEEVKKGRFREDLYYRLNVVKVEMPPLRDRRDDIPLLAAHFMLKYAAENGKKIDGIAPKALSLLCDYPWPGNVRELVNFMERAVVVAQSNILLPSDFPKELILGISAGGEDRLRPGVTIEEMEMRLILKTLEAVDGNKTKAAQMLGVTARTLHNKLADYGLKDRVEGEKVPAE